MAKPTMKIWSDNVQMQDEAAGIEEVMSRLAPRFFRKFRKEMQHLIVIDDWDLTVEFRKPDTDEVTTFRLRHLYKPAHGNLGMRKNKQ